MSERGIIMAQYVATINTPGYLPMDDEPPVFETPAEAWQYLADEHQWGEDMAEDANDSETGEELSKRVRWAQSGLVADFEAAGTVYGPTPGYRGEHDLGLAYSVTETEDES